MGNTVAPGSTKSLVAIKAVKGIEVDGGAVKITIELPEADRGHGASITEKLKEALGAIPGVERLDIVLMWGAPPPAAPAVKKNLLPGVEHVLVVGSGKGGVGKSTVAANLACALAARGHRVGLMDADLCGPSIGMMFGVGDGPTMAADGRVLPVEKHGLKLMSMGFLIDDDKPVIWRGPMMNRALEQFMEEVGWGGLDLLLIDLPPGTGDVQLSICNLANVGAAVIVSTPQDVALLDAKKAVGMFRAVEVPVLGIIENMSGFVCPHCAQETRIFGRGGARSAAEALGLPFLGAIPIELSTREAGDAGSPIVAVEPDGPQAGIFGSIAQKIESALSLPRGGGGRS